MTFPRTERIYEYEGAEYIVHGVTLFKNVIYFLDIAFI